MTVLSTKETHGAIHSNQYVWGNIASFGVLFLAWMPAKVCEGSLASEGTEKGEGRGHNLRKRSTKKRVEGNGNGGRRRIASSRGPSVVAEKLVVHPYTRVSSMKRK